MQLQNYLKALALFTMFFGTWEMMSNKYIKNYLTNAFFYDKLHLSKLIYAHYAYYFLLYFTVWWFVLMRNEAPIRWMIGFFILVGYTLWTWFYYDNKCWLTVKTNEMIGAEDNFGFRDPYDLLMDRYPVVGDSANISIRDKLYYWYVYLVLAIMAFLIFQRI